MAEREETGPAAADGRESGAEPKQEQQGRPHAAEPARPATRMILFRSGGERFALPLEAVREVVVPQPPFARVPRSGAAVRGVMNLRGRVVAVVELAPLVGLAAAAGYPPARPGGARAGAPAAASTHRGASVHSAAAGAPTDAPRGGEPPLQGHVVVLDRGTRGLGFLVEAVLGVDAVPPPAGGASAPILGVADVHGAAVSVLDPDALEEKASALFGGIEASAAPPCSAPGRGDSVT